MWCFFHDTKLAYSALNSVNNMFLNLCNVNWSVFGYRSQGPGCGHMMRTTITEWSQLEMLPLTKQTVDGYTKLHGLTCILSPLSHKED